jgi:hypothetical protein
MQDKSDAGRRPQPGGREPQLSRVDPIVLSRRQLFRSSALTAAGMAALAGGELFRLPRALAQYGILSASPVSNLLLLSTSATEVEGEEFCQGQQLLTGRHVYRFDYLYGLGNAPTVPNDLVATYRDGLCDIDTELNRVLRPTPFKTPDAVPSEFPPAPPSNRFDAVDCYQLVQPLDDQQTLRVYEWCSFYCAQGSVIIIQVGGPNGHLQYNPKDPGIGPAVPVNVVNSFPGIHFASFLPSGNPPTAVGAGFFVADNRQQGFSAETLWTTNLPIRSRQQIRVEANIPGTTDPTTRTVQARYEIAHADGTAVVQVNQQTATSVWVTLGEFEFENGTTSVHLTNETGEPTGTTEIVANAIRWSNA